MNDRVSIKVGGPAGSGVMTLGVLIAKSLKKSNQWVVTDTDYPSLIKGGHNVYHIASSSERIYAHNNNSVDLLVALDRKTISLHENELNEHGAIIYDTGSFDFDKHELERKDVTIYGVDISKIIEELKNKRYYNTAFLGAVSYILNIPLNVLEEVMKTHFKKKGSVVVNENINAVEKGYKEVKEKYPIEFKYKIYASKEEGKRIMMTCNEAVAVGAIRGGVKFYAAYPMTPASSILHFMAAHEESHNIVVKQTEDELAAINTIIGAGMAGVRAMAATSGGGFSLMTEALGMAGVNETNIVIVESQRGGTSTGIPTYTEQGDLRFVMHASQGEFPRIVVAPGDVEEAFYETVNVLNYAEILQVPAIILLDKFLSANQFMAKAFDLSKAKVVRGKILSDEEAKKQKDYKRYMFTEDGISPKALPGQENCMHVCSSYEHDETGATSEEAEMIKKQVDKRAKKMERMPKEIYAPKVYGDRDSEITVFGWGSTKLINLEAKRLLEKEGIKIRVVHLPYILPFPAKRVQKLIDESKKTLIVEGNSESQLNSVIREKSLRDIENKLLKYDGRQFLADEIVEKVKSLI